MKGSYNIVMQREQKKEEKEREGGRKGEEREERERETILLGLKYKRRCKY